MIKVKFVRGVPKREVEELTAEAFCQGVKRGLDTAFYDFHKKISQLEANGESITFENLRTWYPEVNL